MNKEKLYTNMKITIIWFGITFHMNPEIVKGKLYMQTNLRCRIITKQKVHTYSKRMTY